MKQHIRVPSVGLLILMGMLWLALGCCTQELVFMVGVWALCPWDRRGGLVDIVVGFSAGFGT